MAKSSRPLDELTIVLIGSLGSGKSSTGNSILGNKQFKIGTATNAITTEVEAGYVTRGNMRICVIDTPGLQKSSDLPKLIDDIKRSVVGIQTGNIVSALVIQVGRYTLEERKVIEEIFKKHKSALKKTIIIFTNREELYDEDKPADQTVDGWLRKNPSLLSLVQTYKLKYLAFQNKRQLAEENEQQVSDLIAVLCEEDQPTTYCPVSEVKKLKSNLIIVSKELLREKFGTYGAEFFDDQSTILKNVDGYEMMCRCFPPFLV